MKNYFWLGAIVVVALAIHGQLSRGIKLHEKLERFEPQLEPSTNYQNPITDNVSQKLPTLDPLPSNNRVGVSNSQPSLETEKRPQEREPLAIEMNSTITSDIVGIWHEPETRHVCVQLKQDARCPHPALLGRLSGPGLAILEWSEQPSSNQETLLCGAYDHYWLDPGDYFVEIIVLYCKDFGIQCSHENLTAWLEKDHKFDCTEDAERNRITSKEEQKSTIHIPRAIEGKGSYRLGRWVRKPGIASQRPLLTRWQPSNCFRNKRLKHHELDVIGSPLQVYCSSITDRDNDGTNGTSITGLYEYNFQWNMKVSEEELLLKIRNRLRNKNLPKICAVGDSHSRYMVKFTLPRLDLKGLFDYVESIWISPNSIAQKVAGHNCDIFFSQVGQWPASYNTKGHPFSFGKYHDKLKLHVENILKANPNTTIYLPTVDQAPLMARTNICLDWRSPTMLDAFSYVNQMIVRELGTDQVKYIDNNFIIYPTYDGHSDWYHLMELVRSRKTIYMAAIMLGELEWAGLKIDEANSYV